MAKLKLEGAEDAILIAMRGGSCEVALDPSLLARLGMPDPAAWGLLLADAVRHISLALSAGPFLMAEHGTPMSREEVASRIFATMLRELGRPTASMRAGGGTRSRIAETCRGERGPPLAARELL